MKDELEVQDNTEHIIGRAIVTTVPLDLMGGLMNMFSFGAPNTTPPPPPIKNEIKLIVFKRMPGEKVLFAEGQ